ncbi:MAG: GTP 3',8-cyclase MoaA [Spirochaetaceae bacterium]
MNIDNHGRVIDYLRISVTDLCNQRCKYCMPVDGVNKLEHKQILRLEEIIEIVKVAATLGIKKIRITGGEPLIKKGIIKLISGISKIDGIEDIGMTTNAVLLSKYAKDLKEAGLSRLNISLDSLDANKYREMTRGGDLNKVLDGIKAALKNKFPVIKINTVLIGGFNDSEIDDFMLFASKNSISWRLIELMPIGEVSSWAKDNFINGQKLLESHTSLSKDKDSKAKRVKKYYNKDLDISIGLIDTLSGKFCSSCNRLRLTSDGNIKPCLHTDTEYNIFPYLSDENKLKNFFSECILNKPKEHNILEENYKPITRNMNKIGG